MIKQSKTMGKGLSLLEIVLYMGITVIVLGLAVLYINFLIFSKHKIEGIYLVDQDMRHISRNVEKFVKSAVSINSPTEGVSANSLSLEMADGPENPTLIYLSDSSLYIQQGLDSARVYNGREVKIKSLIFENNGDNIQMKVSADFNRQIGNKLYQVISDWQNSFTLRP